MTVYLRWLASTVDWFLKGVCIGGVSGESRRQRFCYKILPFGWVNLFPGSKRGALCSVYMRSKVVRLWSWYICLVENAGRDYTLLLLGRIIRHDLLTTSSATRDGGSKVGERWFCYEILPELVENFALLLVDWPDCVAKLLLWSRIMCSSFVLITYVSWVPVEEPLHYRVFC